MKKLLVLMAGIVAAISTFAADGSFTREVYLDIMEKAVLAYTPEEIMEYTANVDQKGIKEHGFGRLTSNMGIIISHGRQPQLKDQFIKMMDICVREMPIAITRQANLPKNERSAPGNEFAVKEIVCCILECEASGLFPQEKIQAWRKGLTSMKVKNIYRAHKLGSARADNWGVFATASECARAMAGIGGDLEWADAFITDQQRWFDVNGMYKDPNQPITYDFVTRMQFMAALNFGYDGAGRKELEENLLKSAPYTLQMQSVTGEYPFGGRSNGFLFNESAIAAVCEYYASWFKKMGDEKMAARFKAAAQRSVKALDYWLEQKPVRHVKNRFPTETGYGCEGYAYFDKYMVTMGSFAYLAYRFADDSIVPTTKAEKPSTFVMSPDFHRVVMNNGGYTIEFELNAQKDYDSNGLGRVQRAGAPPVILLSCPCPTEHSHYKTDIEPQGPLSIAPCWDEYQIVSADTGKIVLTDGKAVWATKVGKKGVKMSLAGEGDLMMTLPALEFDGETHPEISADEHSVSIRFNGWKAVYRTDGTIVDTGKIYANRSGHLRRYEAHGKGTLNVSIRIEKDAASK